MHIDKVAYRKLSGKLKPLIPILSPNCHISSINLFDNQSDQKEDETRSLLEEVKLLQSKMSEIIKAEESETQNKGKSNFSVFIRSLKGKKKSRTRIPTHSSITKSAQDHWVYEELSRVANLLDSFKKTPLI